MSEINLNVHLRGMIERFSEYLVSDLLALEEQAAAVKPNASTRSAIEIVAHCAAFNRMIAAILTTGQRPGVTDEERDAFLASITTRELAATAFQQTGGPQWLTWREIAQTIAPSPSNAHGRSALATAIVASSIRPSRRSFNIPSDVL